MRGPDRLAQTRDRPTPDSNAPGDQPQPDLLDELITLAHEAGHLFSWKGRTPPGTWATYHESEKRRDAFARAFVVEADDAQLVDPERTRWPGSKMLACLTDEERALIVDEEALAWSIGRELLQARSFDAFEIYDERARRGVHYHRVRLRIDELTLADLEAAGIRLSN